MGNKFCLEIGKSALQHMLLQLKVIYISMYTTQARKFYLEKYPEQVYVKHGNFVAKKQINGIGNRFNPTK